MADNDSGFTGKQMFVAFLAGTATGAAVAMLTSPTSGPQNREKIRDAYDSTAARLKRGKEKVEEKVK
jgi:gas vesicle protein